MEINPQEVAWLVGAGTLGAGYILKVVLPYTAIGRRAEMAPPQTNGILVSIKNELETMNERLPETVEVVHRVDSRLKVLEREAPAKVIATAITQLDDIHRRVVKE